MYTVPMNRRTAEKAATLDHEALATYLGTRGWKDSAPYGEHGRLFTLSTGNTTEEIVVPTQNGLANHRWLMVEALERLARVEERDEGEVVRDVEVMGQCLAAFQETDSGERETDIASPAQWCA